jgi:hypothetical protein
MTDPDFMLACNLLPPTLENLDTALKSELTQQGANALPSYALHIIGSEATDAIRDTLNVNVFELLAEGWSIAHELHEYTDPHLHLPTERSVVFLGEHSLTTTAYPLLTVRVGEVSYPAIRLNLELTGKFRTAALIIQNGHITGLETGDCSVRAQLSCGNVPLHTATSKDITLPGKLKFKAPGLAIH